ncbi:MAG: two-component system response regulator FixJ [Cocleimonas sp.]|jgi:two-component system response regulator FixJ
MNRSDIGADLDKEQIAYIVDDDEAIRDSMSMLLETIDLPHQCFSSANEFFEYYDGSQKGCLILDISMPGMSGLELQEKLKESNSLLPIIFITGHGDIPMAVEAMRRGALDFMRKPFQEDDLIKRIQQAFDSEANTRSARDIKQLMLDKLALLTSREKQVFDLVTEGQANKSIAYDLGISERTVEVHRSQAMKKLEARTLAQLVRIKIYSE